MTVEKKQPANQTNSRRFWQRKSFKILATIGICIVIIVLSVPFAAKTYLQKWLVENGADSAIIENVRFNPFSGVAALEGVNIQKDGKTVFSNSTIYLNVGLKKLLGHEALLQQVTLSDILIDIENAEDGSMRIGSYSIAPSQSGDDVTLEDVAEQVEEELAWIFRADTIHIKNVIINYRQPDLQIELVIEEALIEKINTDPNDGDGNLSLKGTLNGAPVNIVLNALVIAPHMDIQGQISVADFRLDDLAEILSANLKPFSGMAGIDGKIAFSMAENNNLHVAYDGQIHLDQGDLGGESWATKGTLNYDGKVSFAMSQDNMVVDVDGDLQALQAAFDMPNPIIAIDNSDININGKTTVTIAEEVIVDTSASLMLAATTVGMDKLKTSTGETTWDGHVLVETGTEKKEFLVRADGTLKIADPAYSMDIGGSLMEVGNQMFVWDGKVEYIMGPQADSSSFVRTDGTLKSDNIAFSLPEVIQINQKELKLAGKTEVIIGKDLGVSYLGDIALNETSVEMEGITIGDKQLSWSGKAGYELGAANQTISLDGALGGEDIYADIAGMYISQQSLITEAECSLTLAESPTFQGTVSVNGEETAIKKGNAELLSLAEFGLTNARDNGAGGIIIESLLLKKIKVPSSAHVPVTVNVPKIAISDIQSPDLLSANIKQLYIEQPVVIDAEGKTQLAALKSISANTIDIAKDMTVTVAEVASENGLFFKKEGEDALATLGTLLIDQLSYSIDEGLVCNSIDLDSAYANIIKKKSPGNEKKQEEVESGTTNDDKTEKKATGIPVKIKQIKVAGKSGFKFVDESLARSFMTMFAIKSLQVDDIDLNKPKHPFSYTLKGTFDKYSPLSVKGKCAPLAADLILEQKVSLQNLSMQHVSPYTVDAIGTYFPDGFLNYSSQLKLGDAKIDMTNTLVFTDLKSEALEGDLADELNNQLPIPLGLALSMLRDSAGVIDLDIPIDGELSKLHIGVTDLLITALSKGITVAVTPYLAYTVLGPAGALVFVGASVGQSLLHTDLPELEFEPGARELSAEHQEILKKVGEEITDDTEVNFSICAKVTREELSAASSNSTKNDSLLQDETIRKELFELGEQRSLLVKDFLLANFKIDEERLLICNPGLKFEKGSKARIVFKGSAKN